MRILQPFIDTVLFFFQENEVLKVMERKIDIKENDMSCPSVCSCSDAHLEIYCSGVSVDVYNYTHSTADIN